MKLTPVFEQYLRSKDDHPDALLFFRMGDFYEMFFEDAEVAARELSIALTCRNPGADSDSRIPMCGVPHHSAEGYLATLLEKGYKVAICDQVEDPKQAKGLVRREVTRVLTPGTVVEDGSLTAKSPNYLAALYWDSSAGQGGLAWADYSTGEFSGLFSRREPELWQWALKIGPREMLLPQDMDIPPQYRDLGAAPTQVSTRVYFDLARSRAKMLAVQQVQDLAQLDLADKPQLTAACGAILTYLEQTQKRDLSHLHGFRPLNLGGRLIVDEVTERNLELFRRLDGRKGAGSLLHVLDRTITPMGGRLLAETLGRPFRDLGVIREIQDGAAFFRAESNLRASLRKLLDSVFDLERLTTRIHLNRASPKDFVALRNSLDVLPAIEQLFKTYLKVETTSPLPKILSLLFERWDDMADQAQLLDAALVDNPPQIITEGGLFKSGFNARLDELIELTEHGEARLQDLLAREREANDMPKLKLGYNRVFGYYLEVSKAYRGEIPERFIRRQTLVNSERFITEELKELEGRLMTAAEERKDLEYKLFQELREGVARSRARLMHMAERLAKLDYVQGLASASEEHGWARPEVHAGLDIAIREGRHPVVEAVQGRANYIPNDLFLEGEKRVAIITGPNMAGKSTVIRQAAIMTILAQMGSDVPAREARIGLADRVFTRVGASDNLAQGQSTFMVEMMETARILRQATGRSLVVLDEIGRGTSTFDGMSLAWAVAENLCAKGKGGVRTLFATHYHELTKLEELLTPVKNLNIAVKEWKGDIVFLRRLVPGPSDRSYGVEVAKLAGVPRPVVERAKEILAHLEEKSQDGSGSRPVRLAVQPCLPGLETSPSNPDLSPAQQRVLDHLLAVSVDHLSPMEALNLIQSWRQALLEES
ncbi:MAG: DNA mismatch repair protein MutS [Desulfovibrionaceae bacterium]